MLSHSEYKAKQLEILADSRRKIVDLILDKHPSKEALQNKVVGVDIEAAQALDALVLEMNGQDEEWDLKTGIPSNNWLMMQGRNKHRASIRSIIKGDE